MAGEFRREQVQDPLGNSGDLRQGSGLNTPVAVGGVNRPTNINVEATSTATMDKIADWGGKVIREKAAKQWNKDLLEGQMAYQQGKSFDAAVTDGNKWKAEGYHVLEAQTLTSTMLAAQQAEIANSGYALSADEYRQQYVGRLDAVIEGKDPRVQELVRQNMAKQMPVLVGQHTTANLAYSQQRTEEAVVSAVDTISKDPTQSDALLAIASDSPDSPADGLGPEERRAAIAKGISAAFANDNPNAYIKLKAGGYLETLTPEQKAGIDNARNAYMQKQRTTWNADKASAFDSYWDKVDLTGTPEGFSSPIEAATAFAELNAAWGIEMTAEEGYSAMTAAKTGKAVNGAVTMDHIETAIVAGDFKSAAQMAAPALVNMESGGNYSARGPTQSNGSYAIGKYQVMSSNVGAWTAKHWGTVLTPEQFMANPAAQEAVFEGQFGGYIKKYGNVRDAVSVWHSGRPYEQAVREGAADQNLSTQQYTDTIMAGMSGTSYAQARVNNAKGALNDARVQYAQVAYEEMAPKLNALDQARIGGKMTEEDWKTERAAVYDNYNVKRDANDVNHELSVQNAIIASNTEAAKKSTDQAAVDQASTEINAAETRMRSVYDDPNATLADKTTAVTQFAQEQTAAYKKAGIPVSMSQSTGANKQMLDMIKVAVDADRVATENKTRVATAANSGTLGSDPGVDAKTRTKWWKDQVSNLQKDAEKAKANNPNMTEDQQTAMVQQGMMDTMAKSGYVPDEYKARYSAALSGPMVDKNGSPTQEAISTVADYMQMRTVNPRAANMMLDEKSKAIADALVNDAGNSVGGIAFAIQQREASNPMIVGAPDPYVYGKDPAVVSAVKSATSKYFGDDKWFNFFGWRNPDAFRNITADPAQRAGFEAAVNQEVMKKYAMGGGKGRPDAVVKSAMETVGASTAVIGGTPVYAGQGIDITAETFGTGLANFGGSPGRKAEMMSDVSSIDNAIRNYILDNAGVADSGIPIEATQFWSETSSSDSLIPAVTDFFKAQVPVDDPSRGPEYIRQQRAANIDVSPMAIVQRNGGTFAMVSIQPAGGGLPVIVDIPLAKAGENWMKRLQNNQ